MRRPKSSSESDGRMCSLEFGGVKDTLGPGPFCNELTRFKEPGDRRDKGSMHSDRNADTDFDVA